MTHGELAIAPDGTRIAWSRRGAGEPVVLVHGITESASSFDPVTERLASAHEVITLDLRGHGQSGTAPAYDLASMAGDVLTVVEAAGVEAPHLVGHSLGGAVVTAAGAVAAGVVAPVASVVDIDQSLQLESFKEQLVAAEALLRDPDQYGDLLAAMFDSMSGELLPETERTRIEQVRRADHDVVLGVWDPLLTAPVEAITDTVDAALAGYADDPPPYLAVFGLDPGAGYAAWLAARIDGATVDYWPEHGHYPHLVDPDRFVDRLHDFWS
jgi:pimeloyl-ACP methyl ester carboxylesterase